MPQDNTPIEPDNNQMVAQVPSSNDATNPGYASVPVDMAGADGVAAPTVTPVPTATPAPTAVSNPTVTPDPTVNPDPAVSVTSDAVVLPGPEPVATEAPIGGLVDGDIRSDIATKIGENKNVLIALSGDPSVDELSAAIGLSLYLDRIGKRATAIYSGATPNTLEFLKPEETFEPSADTLQDFVIAINKEKADHLRYKLDGDYVKVYITPYKHRLSENDLEFSYGDYNVDLVIALDVANGIDLDSALREHGRIMHDASIINVTTGNPGKFGEIEWSDKKASSVSEMIAALLYDYGGEDAITKDEATAFLTGIVAATNRFSNPKTTPETMKLSSRLMESGANQVLVSKNITPDTENELFSSKAFKAENGKGTDSIQDAKERAKKEVDPTNLEVEHKPGEKDGDDSKAEGEATESTDEQTDESTEINADVTKKEHTLLDDLKAAEESLAHTGEEATPSDDSKMLKIENGQMTSDEEKSGEEMVLPEPVSPEPTATEPVAEEADRVNGDLADKPETVIEPATGFDANVSDDDTNKYGQMLQDALNSAPESVEPSAPIMSIPDADNPAVSGAPSVPASPEINGVPEMNYMPTSGEELLPPPPTPPIGDLPQGMPPTDGIEMQPVTPADGAEVQPITPADGAEVQPITPAAPVVEPEPTPLGEQPAMQDQVYNAQANDPGAFKIPGM